MESGRPPIRHVRPSDDDTKASRHAAARKEEDDVQSCCHLLRRLALHESSVVLVGCVLMRLQASGFRLSTFGITKAMFGIMNHLTREFHSCKKFEVRWVFRAEAESKTEFFHRISHHQTKTSRHQLSVLVLVLVPRTPAMNKYLETEDEIIDGRDIAHSVMPEKISISDGAGLAFLSGVYVAALLACIVAGSTAPELFVSKTSVYSTPSGISSASSDYVFDISDYKVRARGRDLA